MNSFKKYAQALRQFQNIIFYGDSGSGKTFNTIKTVENFESKKVKISQLELEDRIKYISFHQLFSYSYFIERKEDGIIKNGILKSMSVNASLDLIKNSVQKKAKSILSINSRIWKISLGYRKTEERVYNQAKKDNEIVLGWLENESLEGKSYNEIYSMLESKRGNDSLRLNADVSSINGIVNDMKIGDFVLIYQDNTHISDIGIISSDYFHDYGTSYPHKRKVIWLKEFKNNFDISKYDKQTQNEIKQLYELKQIDFSDLKDIMQLQHSKENNPKPYFLIIENIDKGDMFSIFGESFSILDKDKRDNQFINLYISDKNFSLPSNLYIIGTSEDIINNLDIQKRFAFIETETYKFSKKIKLKNGESLDLSDYLDKINVILKTNNKKTLSYSFIENISNIDELNNFKDFKLSPYFKSLGLLESDIDLINS